MKCNGSGWRESDRFAGSMDGSRVLQCLIIGLRTESTSAAHCAGRYAHMAAMDFTAASMVEDLADWDLFVWLAREVAGGAQRDVLMPHSGMLH